MVNHKQALAFKLIPQWKDNYIDYGLLSESLDITVKAVHKLFETQARQNLQHNKDVHHRSASPLRKRRSSNSMHADDGDDGDDRFELQQSTIVVSKISLHQAFVEHARSELAKANTFYASKLLELKFEFLQLLFVQLELGLVERHALVMHDRFDPGSTISIMALQRSHAGIDVRLEESEDEDEEKAYPGDSSSEPLLGAQQLLNPTWPRFSAPKIVFEGSPTEDSRYSAACAGPRRVVEAWLLGSQWPHGADYYASSDDAAFQIRAAERPRGEGSNMGSRNKQHRAEQVESLKLDMLEFYRELLLLQDFGDHNGITLRKIFKKHRKELGGRLERFPLLTAHLKICPFWGIEPSERSREGASLRHLISEAEALYISAFFGQANLGSSSAAKAQRKQAMRELEVGRDGSAVAWVNLFTTWRLGVVVGVVAIVVVVLVFLAAFPNATPTSPDVLVPLYRLSGMGTLFAWVWAASFAVVLVVRVDLVKALKCNPRTIDRSSVSFFEGLCIMTVLWFVTLAMAMASLKGAPLLWLTAVPSDTSYMAIYPMVLCAVGTVVYVGHEVSTGGWLSLCVWSTIRAPTVPVVFKDIFIADQLTSLVICFRGAFFLGCFLGRGDFTSKEATEGGNVCISITDRAAPFVSVLPACWRLMQCLRMYADSCPSAGAAGGWRRWQRGQPVFLYNGLKYSVAFPLAVLSFYVALLDRAGQGETATRQGLSALWWLFAAVDVVYKSYWDIVHDWGLGSADNHFLRPRLVVASCNDNTPEFFNAAESSVRYHGLETNHLYPVSSYYLAVAVNVVLRLSSPLLVSTGFLGVSSRTSVVACCEVFRRGVWNCFRLEKCHLVHCTEQCVRQTQRLEHFQRSVSKPKLKASKSWWLEFFDPLTRAEAECREAVGIPHVVPPLLSTSPSDGALERDALHGIDAAFIPSGDGIELCDLERIHGVDRSAVHDKALAGVESNPDDAKVRLNMSASKEEDDAALRNSAEATEARSSAPFLCDEWLHGKLRETQRGSLFLASPIFR